MLAIRAFRSKITMQLDFYPKEKTTLLFTANEVSKNDWMVFVVNVPYNEALKSEKEKLKTIIGRMINLKTGENENKVISVQLQQF